MCVSINLDCSLQHSPTVPSVNIHLNAIVDDVIFYITAAERAKLARRASSSTTHQPLDLSCSPLRQLHKVACSCTANCCRVLLWSHDPAL